MRQLTGLDASFLNFEDHRNFGHTSGLLIVDPSGLDEPFTVETVKNLMASRLHLIPAFRWRLVEVPLGIDHPYWVDDPDVDLDFHIRELAIPAPFTEEKLGDQVARIAARTLDRSRPLWEMYVVHGLPGGRIGIMTKFHHALVDGVAATSMLTTLIDTVPRGREFPAAPPRREVAVPGQLEMLARGLLNLTTHPARFVRLQAKLARPALGLLANSLPFAPVVGPGIPPLRAPKTTFNRNVGAQRRWAKGTLDLNAIKAVKNQHDCTVNDVVMAICAAAVRRWLIDHDELPAKPLVAAVPVSIRTVEQASSLGNQVSMMLAPIPTDLDDPVDRLEASAHAMRGAKEQHKALPAEVLQEFGEFAAPAAARLIARLAAQLKLVDRVDLPFNLVVSNVPGPRETLYFAGAAVVANHPISMAVDGVGLNITLTSYGDNLDFGIVVDRDQVPDVWNLVGYMREALDELVGSVEPRSDRVAS